MPPAEKTVTIEKASTRHLLIAGDALDELGRIEERSVRLAFADPPYNIGKKFGSSDDQMPEDDYVDWCKAWLAKISRALSDDGTLYVMAATQFMPRIDLEARKLFHIMNRIVWFYDSSGVQAKTRFGSLYEPILWCVKDENNYVFNLDSITVPARTGSVRRLLDHRKQPAKQYSLVRNPGNVWYFPRVRFRMPEYMVHPSQKPELLLERIILASSVEGDTILDPFAGTFTTNAVAAKLRRSSIGIEIDSEYFRAGVKRVREAQEGAAIANRNNFGRTPQAYQTMFGMAEDRRPGIVSTTI